MRKKAEDDLDTSTGLAKTILSQLFDLMPDETLYGMSKKSGVRYEILRLTALCQSEPRIDTMQRLCRGLGYRIIFWAADRHRHRVAVDSTSVADFITRVRQSADISQSLIEKFSRAMGHKGIDQGNVSLYERARMHPTFLTMKNLVEACGYRLVVKLGKIV